MKRALVFSGGGSRGAYEIGAWQALRELDIHFDAVYGTSIGAMNAALVAQDDIDSALELWNNIKITQIIRTDDENFSIDHLAHNKRDIIPFLTENAGKLHMDVTPLHDLVRAHLDEGRVRASGMMLGLMTVSVPQMRPVPKRLTDIEDGQLADWIIASASCFPVFPVKRINGRGYVDGGYFDNMPIDMALTDGAEEIVNVDIHPTPVHPEYINMPFLRSIHPRHDLGGFLDFNPNLLKRMRLMGYYDTMKHYNRFDGIKYTFRPIADSAAAGRARAFMTRIAAFDAEAIKRRALRSSRESDAPLISVIREEAPLRRYSWKDVWLRGLELCAEAMDFREDAIYDADKLAVRLHAFVQSATRDESPLTERALLDAKAKGKRALVSALFSAFENGHTPDDELVDLMADNPRETAAAIFLACVE